MKIIKTDAQNKSSWSEKMIEASIEKYSSLSVEAGNVSCPLINKKYSTINCELCSHCKGIELSASSGNEFVKCSYKYDSSDKEHKQDDIERLFVSERLNNKTASENVDARIFGNRKKYEDLNEKDIISSHKIVSAKTSGHSENDGTSNFVPKYNNSIFNANNLSDLNSEAEKTEEEENKKALEAQKDQTNKKREWENDNKKSLDGLEYQPKGSVMSISHESQSNNPKVSTYKFSIFENIDEKINNIPEKTGGENLKSQAQERKQNISRAKKEDNWEKNSENKTTTSSVVKNFFDGIFKEK